MTFRSSKSAAYSLYAVHVLGQSNYAIGVQGAATYPAHSVQTTNKIPMELFQRIRLVCSGCGEARGKVVVAAWLERVFEGRVEHLL